MNVDTLIAVDPGKSGAIAWHFRTSHGMGVEPMPATRTELIKLLRTLVGHPDQTVAYVEKVANFIPDGGASQMFEFGIQAERPSCILECLGVRVVEMRPVAWQKELGIVGGEKMPYPRPPKDMSRKLASLWKMDHEAEINAAKKWNASVKRDWKNRLLQEAQDRFPKIANITLTTADALLLLDVAGKLEGQMLF